MYINVYIRISVDEWVFSQEMKSVAITRSGAISVKALLVVWINLTQVPTKSQNSACQDASKYRNLYILFSISVDWEWAAVAHWQRAELQVNRMSNQSFFQRACFMQKFISFVQPRLIPILYSLTVQHHQSTFHFIFIMDCIWPLFSCSYKLQGGCKVLNI